jgi:hypothetical protein
MCETASRPQLAPTGSSRIARPFGAVFPVVHTPYDYDKRFLENE